MRPIRDERVCSGLQSAVVAAVLIAATVLLIGLCGCSTTAKRQTCDGAAAAYGAYLAVLNAGHVPSKEEVLAAQGAVGFLTAYCGWAVPARNARTTQPAVDPYGVLVITKP